MKSLLTVTVMLGAVATGELSTPVATATPSRVSPGNEAVVGFGRAVAIAGEWAFIGEPNSPAPRGNGEGPNPEPAPGVVYVYHHLATGWKKSGEIKSPTGIPSDAFGATLATDGTTLLIGQVKLPVIGGGGRGGGGGGRGGGAAAEPDTTSGAVYVYRRGADGKWASEGKLPISGKPGAQIGASLALSGSLALVGAPASGDSTQGSVHVFRRGSDGSWKADLPLATSGLSIGNRFGAAIALSNDRIAVGAPGFGNNGAVFLYDRAKTGEITPQATPLTSRRAPDGAQLGSAIALKGDRVIVGAPAATFGPPVANAGVAGPPAAIVAQQPGDVPPALAGAAAQPPAGAAGVAGAGRGAGGRGAGGRGAGRGAGAAGAAGAGAAGAGRAGAAGAGRAGGGGARGGAGGAIPVFGMVVVFEMNIYTGRWTDVSVLTPFDFSAARFGTALATVGDEIWVGAPGSEGTGRVYRAKQDKSGSWSSMISLGIDSLDLTPQFGATLAMTDNAGIVGLPGDGAGGGTAAFIGKGANGWTVTGMVYPPMPDPFAAVSGKEIRCADGKASSFECSNTGLVAYMPISALGGKRGIKMSDLWGWTDPLTGKDYALIGRTDGTAFVDISDPVHPRYLGDLMRTPGATTSVWREIKTYKNYAFVVSDGSGDHHGIQIFDLKRLRKVTPGMPPQHFNEDAHYNSASIHDITINTESGFAYAVGTAGGTNSCSGGSQIVDIHDPLHPKFVTCFADVGTGRSGRGYTHDIQCVMYHGPDKRYTGHEVCIAANETHISIQDVTDKMNIKVLSHVSYPDVSYAHQGWFTEDQSYWFEDDELDEGGFPGTRGANGNGPNCPCGKAAEGTRTLIWDMKDLTDPILAKEFIGTTHATDHNQFVKGNRLYQSNYRAGLRILDITDPVNPREVGYLDTYPYDTDKLGGGSWGNYPWFKNGLIGVTSETEGFFLIRDRTAIGVP